MVNNKSCAEKTKTEMPKVSFSSTMLIHRHQNRDRRAAKRKKRREIKRLRRWNPWFLGINRAVVTDTSLMLRECLVMLTA